jgi:hypothetical protein
MVISSACKPLFYRGGLFTRRQGHAGDGDPALRLEKSFGEAWPGRRFPSSTSFGNEMSTVSSEERTSGKGTDPQLEFVTGVGRHPSHG